MVGKGDGDTRTPNYEARGLTYDRIKAREKAQKEEASLPEIRFSPDCDELITDYE